MKVFSGIEPFERSGVHTLELIPYRIRYALDHIGLKLSLSQWQTLDITRRENLLKLCHSTDNDWSQIKLFLMNLAQSHEWVLNSCARIDLNDGSQIPIELKNLLINRGLDSISESQWAQLNHYQRYILRKISLGKRSLEIEDALKTYSLL
jgi:hypothetical protein